VDKTFNRKAQKRIRQYLRNNATDAEKKLWEMLKGKQLLGYKFRRQHGIEQYVVDFYCPRGRLAVEIDGATHSTLQEKTADHQRTERIHSHGITVLRFGNTDVFENPDGVLTAIIESLKKNASDHQLDQASPPH
jgi:very-short-patch-repair endonuclease